MECIACGKQFYTWSGRDSSDWQNEFCCVACLIKKQREAIAALKAVTFLTEHELKNIADTLGRFYLLTEGWPPENG